MHSQNSGKYLNIEKKEILLIIILFLVLNGQKDMEQSVHGLKI